MPLLLSLFLNFLLLHSVASDRDLDSHRPRHKVKAVTQQKLSPGRLSGDTGRPAVDPSEGTSIVTDVRTDRAAKASPDGASSAMGGDDDSEAPVSVDLASTSATKNTASSQAADGLPNDGDSFGEDSELEPETKGEKSDSQDAGSNPDLPPDGGPDPSALDAFQSQLDATPSGADNGAAVDPAQDTANQSDLDVPKAAGESSDSELSTSPPAGEDTPVDLDASPPAPPEENSDSELPAASSGKANSDSEEFPATVHDFKEEDADGETPSMHEVDDAMTQDSQPLDSQASPAGVSGSKASDTAVRGLPEIPFQDSQGRPAGIIADDGSDGPLPGGTGSSADMPIADDVQDSAAPSLEDDSQPSAPLDEDIGVPGTNSGRAEDNGPTEEELHERSMQHTLNSQEFQEDAAPAAQMPMQSEQGPSVDEAQVMDRDSTDNAEQDFANSVVDEEMGRGTGSEAEASEVSGSPQELSEMSSPDPAPLVPVESEESSGAGLPDEVSNLYKDTQKVVDRVSTAVNRAGNSITATKTAASSLLSNSASYDTALGKLSDNLRTFNVGVKSFREATAKKHEANTARIGQSLQSGLQAGLTAVER